MKQGVNNRRRVLLTVLAILLLSACLIILLKLGENRFTDTFYEVDDDKIEKRMRIVLLSDLHLHEFGENNRELVEEITRLKPDIIAMAGDMMNDDDPDTSVVTELCRQLIDVAPIYFSFGNHEKQAIRVEQTCTLDAELKDMGVHVLHNRYETADVNGNILDIGGLSANPGTMDAEYTQSFWQDYLKSENYRLLLVHYPNYFFSDGELLGEKIDMALCGHLHGGMVRIPGIGGLYHPSCGLFPEMSEGCHRAADTWVIVSRGLGNNRWYPRINNTPELVIIDVC